MADEKLEEQLEQEQPVAQAPAGQPPSPEPESAAAPPPERDILAETRAWLERVGAGTPETPTTATPRFRTQAPVYAPPQPTMEQPTQDVEQLRALLHEGNDAKFIETLLLTAEQRASRRVSFEQNIQNRNATFGEQVNQFVATHAPDLPPVVFWAFADEAERRFPGQVDKQIDFAITVGRQAMAAHTGRQSQRASANRSNLDRSETLDNGGARARRRGGAAEPDESFVEQLSNFRNKFS